MKRTPPAQMSETVRLGAVLAAAGGFLDAYTYLTRGGVFANAQTGNIVLLGGYLAQGQFRTAGRYLIPILAFAAGVIVAELIKARFRYHPALHWRQITVGAEVAILAAVAFLPQRWNVPANLAVSFVCAMQVESFRKIRGNTYATTMCTGNLRSATELLFRCCRSGGRCEREQCLQYYGIILFFACGAALGALFCRSLGERAVLLACLLLAAAFLLMFRNGETRGRGRGKA